MLKWENAFKKGDIGIKYEGEDGFIVIMEPIWIRGIRFSIIASGRYIGFHSLDVY